MQQCGAQVGLWLCNYLDFVLAFEPFLFPSSSGSGFCLAALRRGDRSAVILSSFLTANNLLDDFVVVEASVFLFIIL